MKNLFLVILMGLAGGASGVPACGKAPLFEAAALAGLKSGKQVAFRDAVVKRGRRGNASIAALAITTSEGQKRLLPYPALYDAKTPACAKSGASFARVLEAGTPARVSGKGHWEASTFVVDCFCAAEAMTVSDDVAWSLEAQRMEPECVRLSHRACPDAPRFRAVRAGAKPDMEIVFSGALLRAGGASPWIAPEEALKGEGKPERVLFTSGGCSCSGEGGRGPSHIAAENTVVRVTGRGWWAKDANLFVVSCLCAVEVVEVGAPLLDRLDRAVAAPPAAP